MPALNKPIRDWTGKRVWIIGASSGIGEALAGLLLERGVRVGLSARNGDALARIAATQPSLALALPLDVTQASLFPGALGRIVDAWGGVDLVLFVAGTHHPVRAWEIEAGPARQLFEVNVAGVLNGLPVVIAQLLKQQGGALGIVSSVAGYRGLPTALVYGASKAALINLAESLYLDLAPKGIGVFLVNPGFVRTPLTDKNTFRMPALISAETAAAEIVAGLERGDFEIHFPRRFTLWLKLLRLLPYRCYFYLVHKLTGL